MRPFAQHRWRRARSRALHRSRKCLNCRLRRRIKKGTRTSFEYRVKPGEAWLSVAPYCVAKEES